MRKKYLIDASGKTPGRLATRIASILIGKHKPGYRVNVDSGDKVVVSNAAQIYFSGKKIYQKVYYRHTMHPGGLKITPAKQMMAEKPEEVIRHAVERMIPKNKLRSARMKRLTFKK